MIMIFKAINELYFKQPLLFPVIILSSIFTSLYPFVNIYLSKIIIDMLLSQSYFKRIFIIICLIVLFNFIINIIINGFEKLKALQFDRLQHFCEIRISEKIMNMDYSDLDNSQIHLMLEKLKQIKMQIGNPFCKGVQLIEQLLKSIFGIIISLSFMINLFFVVPIKSEYKFIYFMTSPFATIVLFIFLLLLLLVSYKLHKKHDTYMFSQFNKIVDINKVFGFYRSQVFNNYHCSKDIHIYNQKNLIEKEFQDCLNSIYDFWKNHSIREGVFRLLNSLIPSITNCLIYLFVGIKAWIGSISIGSIVQYIGSINQFSSNISNFVNSFEAINSNNLYIKSYLDILDYKISNFSGSLNIESKNSLEFVFHNVYFKYPNMNEYILKDISLKITPNKRTAIVGINGSGKTTFIKLLLRLYRPTKGYITLNGIDICEYDYSQYINLFSVVFQDFKLFSFSIAQNISASLSYDKNKVEQNLKLVDNEGYFLNLEKGINTNIYKDFCVDGIEVSGGEAQKIAIAKALYKSAPFIILDEPTAALDPIAESEIYSKFDTLIKNNTSIYISHRLSSCIFCDNIIVFDNGQIIEQGTHQELINCSNSKYKYMWDSQSQYYIF